MDFANEKSSEWRYNDDANNKSASLCGGEEAGRTIARNHDSWNSCEKLKTDGNFHQRYIPIKDALAFKNLSKDEQEIFVTQKSLTSEDTAFLNSPDAVKWLEYLSNAVVCITVNLNKQTYGTGFFVRINKEDVVMTNSHSVRTPNSGDGVDFRLVHHKNIKVISFYHDSSSQVTHSVAKLTHASLPDKNKDENVLKNTLDKNLHNTGVKADDKSANGDVSVVEAALGLLSSYFKRRDTFLDYVLLHLSPLKDEKEKVLFSKMKPITMKNFDKLENFRNVSSFGIADPKSSRYPRSLRLFTISHPHRASMQLSFGNMLSSLQHVYFLQMAYGQNDTGMLSGKEPFAEHSIHTCKGSSGAPIFAYIFDHETGKIIVDECVYFVHFFGNIVNDKAVGKSVSISTILRNLEHQKIHGELGMALTEVGKDNVG